MLPLLAAAAAAAAAAGVVDEQNAMMVEKKPTITQLRRRAKAQLFDVGAPLASDENVKNAESMIQDNINNIQKSKEDEELWTRLLGYNGSMPAEKENRFPGFNP